MGKGRLASELMIFTCNQYCQISFVPNGRLLPPPTALAITGRTSVAARSGVSSFQRIEPNGCSSFQEVVHPVLNEEAEAVEALADPPRTEWTIIRMRL